MTAKITELFADLKMSEFWRDVAQKKEATIREAFERHGFNPHATDFLKQHIQIIIKQGDPFEHYFYNYGRPDEVRIISIDAAPHTEMVDENFSTKIVASFRAY